MNQLEVHEEYHAQHDLKITILLVIVCIQLAITLYQLYKVHAKRQAIKAAKSVANLQQV